MNTQTNDMHFQKQDLKGRHYIWLKNGEPNIYVGQPTRRAFDRFNGDQVLFMINFYGSLSGRFSIAEGREMEQRIIHHLPIGNQSEIAVFNWLRSVPKVIK